MTSDVVIVGAGIVGAACARLLARSGLRVLVLDQGAGAGGTSSHGEGNILVSDKGPGAELALAQHASSLWPGTADELSNELGANFPSIEFDRKGGLVVATTDTGAAPLIAFAETQREVGVDARMLDIAEARELEPSISDTITAAIFYPEDAQVQPVIATEALLASARLAGADVRTGIRVTGAVRNGAGDIVGVRTDAGDISAAAVLVAAGPWSGEVSRSLGAAVPILPRRGMVLVTTRMTHRIFHKVYDGDYVGAVSSSDADLQTSSVVESTASGTVLIGSSRQQVGFDDRLQVRVLQELAAKALRLFPFLAEASLMRSYGGFRPYMPDHLPVIGRDHRVEGLWHASGHEGAGIGLSLATAEIIAAQMTGTKPALDAAPFRLDRPTLARYLAEDVPA
ncbi:glycine/D-amino acid oxidase-like deaminating enzyme [Mycetocola sp. CAN_C7]|uniref:NAD(P)/FAD-dependent oxidoreductase n=1 Tax=Mycetocola sp. CAN_C7 TaxID=2787724 RepID=UPI0018C927B0